MQRTIRNLYTWLALLFACIVFQSSVLGQNRAQETVHLKNGTISALSNAAQWLNNTAALPSGHDPIQALIQFRTLPTEQDKATLKTKGIQLLDYIPANSFVAFVTPSAMLSDINTTNIKGIVNVSADWKADRSLWHKANGFGNSRVEVLVSFYPGISRDKIVPFLANEGATIQRGNLETFGSYKVAIAASQLQHMASWYGVSYLNAVSEEIALNRESQDATKVNIAQQSPFYGGYGLNGDGVTIGVGDNTSGIFHVDLRDRIINYNPFHYTNHGMHINGIVGGAGIADPKGEGTAPHATLVDHLYDGVWATTGTMLQNHNMTITNNSYAAFVGSCGYAGTYDSYSRTLDSVALQHNTVLHVFASGNDGYLDCPPYPKGFATVTGAYQPAKNNIVVTSTDKRFVNATDGSRGPVKDGRLKPEITAVGVGVTSTTRTDEYLTSGGTSMACPAVAGGLALITQRYKQLNGNANPRSDVLKTLLLNGTADIGNPGPDYRYGFGFMDLDRSLQMLNNNRFVTNTVNNGGQQTINITVPPNTAQLKVMLYWHDVPASPLSANQLINDLDLTVQEPSSLVHKPLILDTLPANILNNAVEGDDRINNIEQAIINSPAAGNYTIVVKGFNVPSNTQAYVLAYDFIPVGVHISHPYAGETARASDTLRAYWSASENSNTFTLEYSVNDGGSWNVIDNNIPADQRYYSWFVPNVSTGLAKMRITRNNTAQQHTTGRFVIGNMVDSVRLSAIQCPGYIAIEWTAVPNATSYQVWRKMGPNMVVVDTVLGTSYIFNGLSIDSTYYVSVSPIIDGTAGLRYKSVKRKPDDGNCAGNISDGDLMIEKLEGPGSGRKLTSTELTNNENLVFRLRNLDDAACNNYKLSYSINGGTWQSQTFTNPLPANAVSSVGIGGIDFSATGTYQVRVAIENLQQADPVTKNDTSVRIIKQLNNAPADIAATFTEGFETMDSASVFEETMGILGSERWDYVNDTDTGRARSFVNNDIKLDGNRSISLDAYKNISGGNQNVLTGTFNLAAYNAGVNEARMEFDYRLHGSPKFQEGNDVWVRGKDTDPWQKVFTIDTAITAVGVRKNSGTLSLTDALLNNGQNFSTSFQVKFQQRDTSLIAFTDYGNGITIDNVKLYVVQNDVQLTRVLNPKVAECGLTGDVPLTVRVYNSVTQAQNNVQLYYQLDNGAVVNESITTIAGKDSIDYTFSQKMLALSLGTHVVNVWIDALGDTYRKNDSILNYIFHSQPIVGTYPHLEDLENNNGYWYTEGVNNSWEYGVPSSPKINTAASGTKVWKTNLDGTYNDNELSYLYSPCYNVSTLANPYFKVKLALDIEDCADIFCDAAYMQYSTDGGTNWNLLGDHDEGTYWYNDSNYKAWTREDSTDWREAEIALPKGQENLKLRFVMYSDPGGRKEGIAVDDMGIYDKPIPSGKPAIVSVSPNPNRDNKIKVIWEAAPGVEMKMFMTDILGRVIFRQTVIATGYRNETIIHTGDLYNGVYPIRFIIGDDRFEYKIVYQ